MPRAACALGQKEDDIDLGMKPIGLLLSGSQDPCHHELEPRLFLFFSSPLSYCSLLPLRPTHSQSLFEGFVTPYILSRQTQYWRGLVSGSISASLASWFA